MTDTSSNIDCENIDCENTDCISVTPIAPVKRNDRISLQTEGALGGSFNLNIVNEHELAHRLKYENFMQFYGLGDFDSYFTLELDSGTATAFQKYVAHSENARHLAMIAKMNIKTYSYGNPHQIMGMDERNDDETEVEYLVNDWCFNVEFNGDSIICIVLSDPRGSSKIVLLSKTDLEILKRFANKIRADHEAEEREKRVIQKQIMVFTNYRKGQMDGAVGMMAMEHDFMYNNPRNVISDWKPTQAIRARSFESIFLSKEPKKALLGDIEDFMSDDTRTWYDFHDIPSKRSYLFYGPPGTGKTSTVKAIAGKYDMQLYIMKLNLKEMDDMAATNLMQQLPARSILLIEDIDANFTQHGDKADAFQALTFSGLMNILDGITSFNQQLVIMTTNKRDMVNRESLRTGRIDMEIEFGYMDSDQARNMLQSFYEDADNDEVNAMAKIIASYGRVTPAELQEIIIRSKNYDFDYIETNFKTLIESVRAGRETVRSGMFN
jgi:ATPase family associated with various cellular activities (AAA)